MTIDIVAYNRRGWDHEVEQGNPWTVPVDSAAVARARSGEPRLLLTPTRPIPAAWLGNLRSRDVLGLASGGGQQGPLLAAAGANVTIFDNSPAQLAQDRAVAERESLELRLVQGDMADLSAFAADSFDLIVHPVSNCFVPDVLPVWREAFRVLRPGGALLAGFTNPLTYIFDPLASDRGELVVRHAIPYSDLEALSDEERRQVCGDGPLEFGHSLDDQMGGQLAAGFRLTGFYEDRWPDGAERPENRFIATFIATRAEKPRA